MNRLLLLTFSAILLSACGDTDNAEPPAELVDFESSLQVEELWSVSTGEGVGQLFLKLFPLVLEDRIIVADREGKVSAFTLSNGKRLWQVELDEVLSGGVGGDKHNLILTGRNGHVIKLDGEGQAAMES